MIKVENNINELRVTENPRIKFAVINENDKVLYDFYIQTLKKKKYLFFTELVWKKLCTVEDFENGYTYSQNMLKEHYNG